ncbi:MAG: GNAT family N-acetyltransferase [Chloroflexi bacterium]|nr:GNAT family N-acetyltransferase [Chloroflexota bacterium]
MSTLFDFSQFPALVTERLVLRQIVPTDAPAMMAIFGSPDVLRFLNSPPMDTHEKAIGFIDWLAGNYANHQGVDWAITRKGEDAAIGMCGAYGWDRENRRVDIGYHVQPSFWGQGYATEAARAIIQWCFDRLDVHRVQADCTEGNDASERVMIKCGFTQEGIWRESCWEHGRFVNIKQYGLLRREFAS